MGKRTTTILEGTLSIREADYGTNMYEFLVDRERLISVLRDFEGHNVRITIEQIPDSSNNGD